MKAHSLKTYALITRVLPGIAWLLVTTIGFDAGSFGKLIVTIALLAAVMGIILGRVLKFSKNDEMSNAAMNSAYGWVFLILEILIFAFLIVLFARERKHIPLDFELVYRSIFGILGICNFTQGILFILFDKYGVN